tara:strand:- start:2776 stop:2940 length:165 start_codon:yes stop_codon:yes gene_type:complete
MNFISLHSLSTIPNFIGATLRGICPGLRRSGEEHVIYLSASDLFEEHDFNFLKN